MIFFVYFFLSLPVIGQSEAIVTNTHYQTVKEETQGLSGKARICILLSDDGDGGDGW